MALEIYITGYGTIHSPKVLFYPPPTFVLSPIPTETHLGELPNAVGAGARGRYWYASLGSAQTFADADDTFGTNIIASEIGAIRGNPPIRLPLRTRHNIPAGIHSLQFFFTYFNGNEWKTDSQSASIVVPNWFRRHEGWTFAAAIIAVVITLVSLLLDIADKFPLVRALFRLLT